MRAVCLWMTSAGIRSCLISYGSFIVLASIFHIIHGAVVEMFHNLTFSATFYTGTAEEEADPSLHEPAPPHHIGRIVVRSVPPLFPMLFKRV